MTDTKQWREENNILVPDEYEVCPISDHSGVLMYKRGNQMEEGADHVVGYTDFAGYAWPGIAHPSALLWGFYFHDGTDQVVEPMHPKDHDTTLNWDGTDVVWTHAAGVCFRKEVPE